MKRSKARDISPHQSPATALNAGSPLKLQLPANATRKRPLNIDFSVAAPWGRVANEFVNCFIASLDGLSWAGAAARYGAVRRFAFWLVHSVWPAPSNWSDVSWSSLTNDWILERQRSVADSYANAERGNIQALFKSIWRAEKVAEFELLPSVSHPSSTKKPDLGSIVQSGPFDYSVLTKEQTAVARRLEQLTNITDPAIHKERLELLQRVLVEHASSETRQNWHEFDVVRQSLQDPGGLDIDRFLSVYRTSRAPLRFKRGWQKKLRNKRDRIRFLCHPEVYSDAILSGNQNCVKKWLSEEKYSVRDVCNALHATIENVIPLLTLVIVDLTLEESSALSMKTNCCTETDEGKSVSIQWIKSRSGEMQADVRSKGDESALHLGSTEAITSFQALGFLNQLRSRIEHLVPVEDTDALFVVCNQTGGQALVGRIHELNISKYFHRFRKRHPILAKFNFTPDKLRGTDVLKEHLETGDLLKTAKKARHRSLKTTKKYVETVSATHVGRDQVREVQDLLLLNSLPAHSELQSRLGLDRHRAKKITERVSKSGFLEWFPTPGAKTKRTPDDRQSQFMEWLLSGQHIVLETPEVAAELFAYKQHLLTEAPALRDTDEWWDVWAPTLLYLTKALQAIRPDIRIEGEQLAAHHQIEYMEV